MLEWYRGGSRVEKKTFWACYLGWALDSYDTQIFSFLLPTLLATWSLSKGAAGAIGTVSLISAAIGGWFAGILSDRIGRVKVLRLTVLWFTVFGVLAGFATSYDQMLIARVLQGLGFGGEWAVGAALMAEVTRPEHRGRALGFVQSGFCLGWTGAVLVATWALSYFPQPWGWRVAFWIGVVPAFLILLVCMRIRDSPMFMQVAHEARARKATLTSVFQPEYLRTSLLSSLMVLGLQAAGYVVAVWIPSLLTERGLNPRSMILSILVMAVGAFCGFAFTASSCDKWGRRPTLTGMTLCCGVVTLAYMFVPGNPLLIQFLGFLIGFFVIGIFAAVGPFLSELFPTQVRTTCMGFCYNAAKTLGAPAIAGVGVLSTHIGLATAIGASCFASYAISIVALLALPETKGVNLAELDAGVNVHGEVLGPPSSVNVTGHL
jgi:MFS family permease